MYINHRECFVVLFSSRSKLLNAELCAFHASGFICKYCNRHSQLVFIDLMTIIYMEFLKIIITILLKGFQYEGHSDSESFICVYVFPQSLRNACLKA